MKRYYLTELCIEGFRGINNSRDPLKIKLRTNAVNSIHAPNGIGKTSIFEAIHYAIFDTVPRLEELQTAEEPESYYINKFHPNNTATIKLSFTPDDGSDIVEIQVIRDSIGNRLVSSPTKHPTPDLFLKSLREDFTLVDYRKFSEFINSSALIRGRSFASLVGLSEYSDLRQALERVANTRTLNTDFSIPALEAEIKNYQRNLAECIHFALIEYKNITGQEAINLNNKKELIDVVTNALSSITLLKPIFKNTNIMSADFKEALRLVTITEGGEKRKRYEELGKDITELDAIKPELNDPTEIIELRAIILERDNAILQSGSSILRDLYKAARLVTSDFSWEDPNKCPTCETRLNFTISSYLDQQLSRYTTVDDLNNRISIEIQKSNLISRLQRLEETPKMRVPIQDRQHANILQASKKDDVSITLFEETITLLESLESTRLSKLEALYSEKSQLEKDLPPSLVTLAAQIESANKFRDYIERHDKIVNALNTVSNQLNVRNQWKEFIDRVAKLFAKAESALATQRIQQIENNYQKIFSELIRGGMNVKPQLQRAEKSEQVELKLADFYNLKNINARAVLSESYRNAVAAAIFLSAAVIHKGTPRFIILDDVTSSFDAGHQFNLMEVIRTQLQQPANPDGLQFIILSHDTMLEKYFDRLNGGTDWHHQKLQGMPPVGRVMVSAQESDRLRQQAELHLNAGQTDIGAPLLRHYLEYKLGQIIIKLQILVPPDYAIKGDKRTLSSYMDAIMNAVKLYNDANRLVLTAQQVSDFNTIHAPAIIANFISHYETGTGTPFSPHVLLGVLQTIASLDDCFRYVDNSIPPKKVWYKRLDLK